LKFDVLIQINNKDANLNAVKSKRLPIHLSRIQLQVTQTIAPKPDCSGHIHIYMYIVHCPQIGTFVHQNVRKVYFHTFLTLKKLFKLKQTSVKICEKCALSFILSRDRLFIKWLRWLNTVIDACVSFTFSLKPLIYRSSKMATS